MTTNQGINESAFYTALGERIKAARKAKNLDQNELARAISLTRTSVINIEKGRQRPSIYQVWAMAQILGVSITDLIPSPDFNNHQFDSSFWQGLVNSQSRLAREEQKKTVMDFINFSFSVK